MKRTKSTLEQWLALQMVVEFGGFAKASEKLHRTQSAVSHSLAKLQSCLGVELLRTKGRKAELTHNGKLLLQRSRLITQMMLELEDCAEQLKQGNPLEIHLMVDAAIPIDPIMQALHSFSQEKSNTRVNLKRGVLSGPIEALTQRKADIVILSKIPIGYIGTPLCDVRFVLCAHKNHLLHRKNNLTMNDLQPYHYIVVSDSGFASNSNAGWLGSEKQWKVDSFPLQISMLRKKIGYAWVPEHLLEENRDLLAPLSLNQGAIQKYPFYIVARNPELKDNLVKLLLSLIQDNVDSYKSTFALAR